jgi:hypothetical protein
MVLGPNRGLKGPVHPWVAGTVPWVIPFLILVLNLYMQCCSKYVWTCSQGTLG